MRMHAGRKVKEASDFKYMAAGCTHANLLTIYSSPSGSLTDPDPGVFARLFPARRFGCCQTFLVCVIRSSGYRHD